MFVRGIGRPVNRFLFLVTFPIVNNPGWQAIAFSLGCQQEMPGIVSTPFVGITTVTGQ
jgi:hypothetical protein